MVYGIGIKEGKTVIELKKPCNGVCVSLQTSVQKEFIKEKFNLNSNLIGSV